MNAWDLPPSSVRTPRKDRLFRRIADQLAAQIESGEIGPGQRLPAERELARQLGVSRPSVRQALIMLQVEGMVEARNGAGVFVLRVKPARTLDVSVGDHGLLEVLRARRIVEGEVAAMAARARNLFDVLALRHALEPIEDLARNRKFGDASDRRFHLAVAVATHNDAMVTLVGDLYGRPQNHAVERAIVRHWAPALRAANLVDHRALVGAIEARDRRGARVAMQRLLDRNIWIATLTQLERARARRPTLPQASRALPCDVRA
jgi:DNA-binding FadR family transcriptional regulator